MDNFSEVVRIGEKSQQTSWKKGQFYWVMQDELEFLGEGQGDGGHSG